MLYNINMAISLINNSKNTFKLNTVFISYTLCSIIYTLMRYDTTNSPIIDLLLLITYYFIAIIYLIVINKCSMKKLIYTLLIYLSISSLLHSVFRFVFSLFYENYLDQIIKSIITLFVNVLIILIILRIKHSTNKIILFQTTIIPNYVYVLILLAMFFSGGLIESQITITNEQVQSDVNKLFTIITIFLLIFIIASLVFNCISKAYFENISSILEKQVNAQVDYYKKVDKLNKDLRDFRHDYKNHMICVQGLLDAQEYDEAREYVHGITLRKTILSKEFASGNSIADSLLSDKAERAERIGAELQFKGVIFEDIPSVDLCTILSNALDNAIEACEKISSDEPKIIVVKCSYIKHIQFILISNPVAEDVKIINNTVETSKADKNIHGIGLYNIRRTVAKYEGEFEISCKDKMFVMDIGFKVD